MFNNAQNVVISGGTYSIQNGMRARSALDRLRGIIAPNALHDSRNLFQHTRCHENTRSSILAHLRHWIAGEEIEHPSPDDRIERNVPVAWLYGPAGSGKSSIFQTIAEDCTKSNQLLASFFFWKSDPTRNQPHSIIATICYQIMQKIPAVKKFVERILDHDPLIFEKSIQTQMERLLLEPLQELGGNQYFNERPSAPRLIIIDGLDECIDISHRGVLLRALSGLLTAHSVPFVFLISSRPEQDISFAFNSPPLDELRITFTLDNQYEPDNDIELFLRDSFKRIVNTHPFRHHIPEGWPDNHVIDTLGRKSSGQFIFASVVVKYVSAQNGIPPKKLDVVMGLRPAVSDLPFVELDAIYTHLMTLLADVRRALDIISLGIISGCVFTDRMIEDVLGIEGGDVELTMAPLSSIITLRCISKTKKKNAAPLHGLFTLALDHASFLDFLCDKSRSAQFYLGSLIDKRMHAVHLIVTYFNSSSSMVKNTDTSVFNELHTLIRFLVRNDELTESWYQVLCNLNLQMLWDRLTGRYILQLLHSLLYCKLSQIYLQSLKPILQRDMLCYLSDSHLTALIIIRSSLRNLNTFTPDVIYELLDMPQRQRDFDAKSFVFAEQDSYLDAIIEFLFNPSNPDHLSIRRKHFDSTARLILSPLFVQMRSLHGRSARAKFLTVRLLPTLLPNGSEHTYLMRTLHRRREDLSRYSRISLDEVDRYLSRILECHSEETNYDGDDIVDFVFYRKECAISRIDW